MNDLVKKYLVDKYGENFDQDAQNQYSEATDQNAWAQLGSNIGDAIAGNKVGSANAYFQDLNKQAKENTIGKIDKDREQYVDNQIKSGQIADIQRKAEGDDANSERNQKFRAAVMATAPKIAKVMGDKFNSLTENNQDTLFKFYQLNEQTEARKEQARILAGQKEQDRKDKLAAKAEKDKELSSTEAKQLGLYKTGILAEKQFADATSDTGDYDPTESGQWIDNSEWAPNWMKNNKAIESQAAMSNWVEAYLRDASGAAIPPSERMAYARDYFPQPGDTKAVIENKQALRIQKMDNARVGAGSKAQNLDPEMGKTAEQLLAGSYKSPGQRKKQSADKALKWALENPDDPRAQDVIRKAAPQMKAGF